MQVFKLNKTSRFTIHKHVLLHVHMYRVVTTKYTFVPKKFIPINCLFLVDSRKLFRTQYNNTTRKA